MSCPPTKWRTHSENSDGTVSLVSGFVSNGMSNTASDSSVGWLIARTRVTILNPYLNFPLFSTILFRALGHSSLTRFPHAPLGPSPNHLTSHLIDHMTNPQSTITCHHSAVRSIMTCPHLTLFDLPAHDGLFLDCQLMMELYLEPPRHDCTLVIFPYFFVTSVTRYFSIVYKHSYF